MVVYYMLSTLLWEQPYLNASVRIDHHSPHALWGHQAAAEPHPQHNTKNASKKKTCSSKAYVCTSYWKMKNKWVTFPINEAFKRLIDKGWTSSFNQVLLHKYLSLSYMILNEYNYIQYHSRQLKLCWRNTWFEWFPT